VKVWSINNVGLKKEYLERFKGHPIVDMFILQPKKIKEDSKELFIRLKIHLKNYKKDSDESLRASELVCRLCEQKIPLYKFLV
jgi:hypothetical protein